MPEKSSPESILELIEKQVEPLNPPVKSFENSITRSTPFRILISVLISSRTKDDVTKPASERLFSLAETPEDILKLGEERVSKLIYPVGFFRQKGKNIIKIAEKLVENGGKIPSNLNDLTTLPGVGRKTANLVLSLAFNIPSISVDIHVFRISKRIGWAFGDKPELVEEELKKIFPKKLWRRVNQSLVGFGQTICKPVNPSCSVCSISSECSFYISGS
ncbi:MAG: endonuclease III [Acidobacteriota bacterium]